MSSSVDGLSSGLDTTTIINQLMAIERRPQDALKARKSAAESARTELAGIRSDVSSLASLIKDFKTSSTFNALKATTTNPEAVTVKAASGVATGNYSFQVTSLATAASMYSTATFPSLSSVVAPTGASLFTASGYQPLGIKSLSGTGFDPGDIDLKVFQASTAAKLDSVVKIPAVPIQIDGTNDGIDLTVNGSHFSVTLAHGTYNTETAVASALNAAIAANPDTAGTLKAGLTIDKGISLATTAEGSSHWLAIDGGTALDALGLTSGDNATGTDGIIQVNGIQTTVSDTAADTELTLDAGGGASITAVLSGPLRAGTALVAQTSLGGGTLSDVVSTVNRAGLGYTASAVNVGGSYRLQLTANHTGADSAFDADPAIFGSTDFTQLSAGTDAELTIEGDNPFTISSATNTFNALMPGVDVTVNKLTDIAVTVSTTRDDDAATSKVSDLVTKLNDLIGRIAKSTANAPGQAKSVLQRSNEARRVAESLRAALVGPIGGSSLTSVGVVGIQLSRDGTLTFDKTKFADTLAANHAEMAKLFSDQAGSGQGVLDRMASAADAATRSSDGYLFSASESNSKRIDDYGKQIDAYDQRLTTKEAALRKTYANLEVALSGLKKQSASLVTQLGTGGA